MIKVFFVEPNKDRNITTFAPLLKIADALPEFGLQRVLDEYRADLLIIGQSSILDKKFPLNDAVTNGIKFLQQLSKPYVIIDGQDSHSLIGIAEILAQLPNAVVLKNSLLADWKQYEIASPNGRLYWKDIIASNYRVDNIASIQHRISLSGTNWLLTMPLSNLASIKWADTTKKPIDVFAYFGTKTHPNLEYGIDLASAYTNFRQLTLDNTPSKFKVAKLYTGQRVSSQEYHGTMLKSKIVLAPFGFGEIAPRDIEAAICGCLLLKPDMSYIVTSPNPFTQEGFYYPYRHDATDLGQAIECALDNYEHTIKQVQEQTREIMKTISDPMTVTSNFIQGLYNIGAIE